MTTLVRTLRTPTALILLALFVGSCGKIEDLTVIRKTITFDIGAGGDITLGEGSARDAGLFAYTIDPQANDLYRKVSQYLDEVENPVFETTIVNDTSETVTFSLHLSHTLSSALPADASLVARVKAHGGGSLLVDGTHQIYTDGGSKTISDYLVQGKAFGVYLKATGPKTPHLTLVKPLLRVTLVYRPI